MPKDNLTLGVLGEDLATEHLVSTGYEIIARNHKSALGEIDIIAKRGGILVFVEVKTKTSNFFGRPEEMVTPTKQVKLKNLTNDYLSKNSHNGPVRIDVIAVNINSPRDHANIKHFDDLIDF